MSSMPRISLITLALSTVVSASAPLSAEDRERLGEIASLIDHNFSTDTAARDSRFLRKLAQQHYGVEGAGEFGLSEDDKLVDQQEGEHRG